MSQSWCVLQCKPYKEEFVHKELSYNNVEHYFPAIHVKPVNPRSRKIRPYFPGYIFVHINLDDENQTASLRWVPGTVGLVSFDGLVSDVPDSLINALQKRVAELPAKLAAEQALNPGDRVRVVYGPFEGYEGIFDMNLSGKERVQVLIRYLRDNVRRVEISRSSLVKVS